MWESNLNLLETHKLSLRDALIPVIALIILLTFNITIYGEDTLTGSNQIILLIGAALAYLVGFKNNISSEIIFENVSKKSSYITPVPGGVGPMTIACLMRNTVNGTKRTLAKSMPTPPS